MDRQTPTWRWREYEKMRPTRHGRIRHAVRDQRSGYGFLLVIVTSTTTRDPTLSVKHTLQKGFPRQYFSHCRSADPWLSRQQSPRWSEFDLRCTSGWGPNVDQHRCSPNNGSVLSRFQDSECESLVLCRRRRQLYLAKTCSRQKFSREQNLASDAQRTRR